MFLASSHLLNPVSLSGESSAFPLSTLPTLALLRASHGGRPANTCRGMRTFSAIYFSFTITQLHEMIRKEQILRVLP